MYSKALSLALVCFVVNAMLFVPLAEASVLYQSGVSNTSPHRAAGKGLLDNTAQTRPSPSPNAQQPAATNASSGDERQEDVLPPASSPPVNTLPSGDTAGGAGDLASTLASDDVNPLASVGHRHHPTLLKLARHDYQAADPVELSVSNPDRQRFTTKVFDTTGQSVPVAVTESTDGTTSQVGVRSSAIEFRPGKYTVAVTDASGTTSKQDFTWGVLALNPDQDVYSPGDTADLAMAVLDAKGNMVCNATVTLTITKPDKTTDTLATTNGGIGINGGCESHEVALKPDYEATYHVTEQGQYNLSLSAQTDSGTYTITSSIHSVVNPTFVVKRVSATRIYPPNTYPMQLQVTAGRDFDGTIAETVPESFTITASGSAANYNAVQAVYATATDDPGAVLATASAALSLVMPFDGNYPIAQGFGHAVTDPTLLSFYNQYGLAGHDGIDFACPIGTPLYAVDAGTIIWSGPGDYGTQVVIKHSWGQTYYGHMSITTLKVGDTVQKGTLIGYSGMSGEATGPHLHFGMKPTNPDMHNGYDGKIDPLPYLPAYHETSAQQAGINVPSQAQLSVLGAATGSATPALGSASAGTPTPQPSLSVAPTVPASSPPPVTGTTPSQPFTVGDSSIAQEVRSNQNLPSDNTKVISWRVHLKKGEPITLGYTYQAPQISPQFYLVGPLRFFSAKGDQVALEQRSWQIAADALGTDWYNSGTGFTGYEWPYRKQITIDHTKVGATKLTPTFDASTTAQNASNVSTLSWNHTVTSTQSNCLLIVTVDIHSTQTVQSITYNGVGLSKINSTLYNSSADDFEMWYMTAPATGTNQILVTLNGNAGAAGLGAGASSYYNVDQTTPLGTQNTATGASGSAGVTVTSNTTQLIVDGVANPGGFSGTPAVGQTSRWNNGSWKILASSDKPGAATNTSMGWTIFGASAWVETAVPLNGSLTATDQSNFPVLVSLTSDSSVKAHAQSTGNDILFTDSTGRTKLAHEIEHYDNSTGELEAWVKVPSVSASSNTSIYMYYGNGSIGNQQQATSVWDSNYRMVTHMKESGTCPTFADSTSNAFNFSCSNNPTATTGQIDGARTFNGTTQLLTGSTAVDDTMTTQLTESGWIAVNSNGSGSNTYTILDDNYVLNSKGFDLVAVAGAGQVSLQGDLKTSNSSGGITGATALTQNAWYYAVFVFDGSRIYLYLNGALIQSTGYGGTVTVTTSALTAGAASGGSNFFNGSLDELRVSDTARSNTWIATEYQNQSSPSTFYTLGSEETKIYSCPLNGLMRHGQCFNSQNVRQPFLF